MTISKANSRASSVAIGVWEVIDLTKAVVSLPAGAMKRSQDLANGPEVWEKVGGNNQPSGCP